MATARDIRNAEQRRQSRLEEGVFILLLLLSMLGIAVTRFSPEDGYAFWLFMVTVFAGISIAIGRMKAKNHTFDFAAAFKEQLLHWASAVLVAGGAFLLQKSGRIDENAATLVVLLILSLATMLDGIRIGWQLGLIGLFLGACAIIIAYVEQFMLPVSVLAGLLVIVTLYWEFKSRKQADQ
ncbi:MULTISPECIES: hypothetical protein [Methylomonas]|uniref:Uncharacterized protein n=2 Tax=Methylomonas TaxID=416 RepID=A0A177NHE0_9GAMM|nr:MULTISPECIES: hypothetical protein [Methylomonas]NJA06552.1 hypothetical protein [Methylococcaceae bacterium WWC4]OAI16863.1 hypothetical protein A1355_08870 [Methylomonas koyamae]OHX37375.1 hypothetical protein BJL95_02295 [Methylomonas sp. LWB]